ncbi:uncharacterized protein LOC122429059 isoform X1 [Cervus canadensis]|uniref:uncharacterized protein LOC122429059 isoform X1 n=1 Tax=Cervus canadensis TaxID=1574408 RepID=UPI001CA32301|nr:uncharacterized protein LOC122429059 isoform X1 [Cervus canadensis]XP_043305119.1 uncharacterized protein LOC122429059 isoform X1 [Cervus canadensis]XP_043305120.1 uncharacterized protein LOC122429059 isoform X1 [Cervus canadensis]XP_043305121.1 uncharacterized protein LOC122429059 isoform X1 [Cervus canadensis]XP_043305122.1 uncharacterized protein LOC122429059 isoform X1 [Cervus canadensis]XP_043305123.1 uncharacterized protein LOC122429059 isoform X1 [Cervus canadensis]
MSLLPGDHRSLDTQRGQWVKFQAIKKKYGCFSNVPTGAIPTSLERAVASECGCQEESRNAKEPKHVRPSCSHTHTPQTPRKRVRITGKETANQAPSCAVLCFFLSFFFILKPDRLSSQLQGCIAAGTPSFSWLPELLLLSPGFGFSMAHGNAASSVYAAQKNDLLVELWPGSPRSQARGLGGQGDAGEDPGWDG